MLELAVVLLTFFGIAMVMRMDVSPRVTRRTPQIAPKAPARASEVTRSKNSRAA